MVSTSLTDVKVRLGIYTTSKRLVWESTMNGATTGKNQVAWDGRDRWRKALGNGTYYFSATVERNGKRSTKVVPILILR